MTSVGHAQHKVQRSINVEVNLISTWVSEQAALAKRGRKQSLSLAIAATLGIGSLPIAASFFRVRAANSQKSSIVLKAFKAQETALSKSASSVNGSINRASMLAQSRKRSETLLRQFVTVVNCAPAGVAFTTLSTDISEGVATIRVQAAATNGEVSRTFVERASRGTRVTTASQTALKRSNEIFTNGVQFDFIRKASVN